MSEEEIESLSEMLFQGQELISEVDHALQCLEVFVNKMNKLEPEIMLKLEDQVINDGVDEESPFFDTCVALAAYSSWCEEFEKVKLEHANEDTSN